MTVWITGAKGFIGHHLARELAGSGHAAFFTGSQFPESGNKLGVIQFQSSGGLTGVGLRYSPSGSFTSVPIIR